MAWMRQQTAGQRLPRKRRQLSRRYLPRISPFSNSLLLVRDFGIHSLPFLYFAKKTPFYLNILITPTDVGALMEVCSHDTTCISPTYISPHTLSVCVPASFSFSLGLSTPGRYVQRLHPPPHAAQIDLLFYCFIAMDFSLQNCKLF